MSCLSLIFSFKITNEAKLQRSGKPVLKLLEAGLFTGIASWQSEPLRVNKGENLHHVEILFEVYANACGCKV